MANGTRADVVVVGGGPAGLAAAAMLRRGGVSPLVLERGDGVATAWRERYDSLRLHTVRWLSGLPGMPIPRSYGRWVARDDLVRYLEDYAVRFAVSLRFATEVTGLSRLDGGWRLETSTGPVSAAKVVLATGATNIPHTPDWPGLAAAAVPVIHSSAYREPMPYQGQRVLVVGGGNSAAEIAVDLVRGGAGAVEMAVRTPPNIVRRETLGVPGQALAIALRRFPERVLNPLQGALRRLSIPDLSGYGLPAPSGDSFSLFVRTKTVPILDYGFVAAVRAGQIAIRPAVVDLDGDEVVYADDSRSRPDVVIAATGFRPGLEPLLGQFGLLDGDGLPVVEGARTSPAAPDLYTVGISIQLTGLLREIGRDARAVSDAVVRAG